MLWVKGRGGGERLRLLPGKGDIEAERLGAVGEGGIPRPRNDDFPKPAGFPGLAADFGKCAFPFSFTLNKALSALFIKVSAFFPSPGYMLIPILGVI